MTIIITRFIACRPVDWSIVEPFLPDRPRPPVEALAIKAACSLCGIAVWLEPVQQTRRPFGPVICFLCAIFTIRDANRNTKDLIMSQTILQTQVLTRETEWPESTEVGCGTTIEHEGVTWICTRERGHADWSTPVHAAHYDQPDPFPHSMVGIAWIDEQR